MVMSVSTSALASVFSNQIASLVVAPWACPSAFGAGARYRLDELIHAGPRSLVYRATDLALSSEGFEAVVAIKIARLGRGPAHDRLIFEGITARRVVHPNVVRALDRGVDDDSGASYTILEYVEGTTLRDLPTPCAPRVAATIAAKLAGALQAAHSEGIVHCDLKPDNILMTPDGDPKLTDFDLAFSPITPGEDARGNAAFMAPEQLRRDPNAFSPLSDIFALGGILAWLLTGKLPHGETLAQIGESHANPKKVALPEIDRDLAAIVHRALAPERSARYATADALRTDLEAWLQHRPVAAAPASPLHRVSLWRKRRPAAAVACAAALACAAATGIGTAVWQFQDAQTRRDNDARFRTYLDGLAQKMNNTLRGMAQEMGPVKSDWAASIPVSAAWLEWLSGPATGGVVQLTDTPSEFVFAVRGAISHCERHGLSGSVDAMMARLVISQLLITAGEGPGAFVYLDEMDKHWRPRMDANDPLQSGLDALRACAQVQLERLPVEQRRARLEPFAMSLAESRRCESIRLLVERVASGKERPLDCLWVPDPNPNMTSRPSARVTPPGSDRSVARAPATEPRP